MYRLTAIVRGKVYVIEVTERTNLSITVNRICDIYSVIPDSYSADNGPFLSTNDHSIVGHWVVEKY